MNKKALVTRLSMLTAVSLMLIPVPQLFAGGLCGPTTWDQRLATINPDGSVSTFFPDWKYEVKKVTEYKAVAETITKLVDGKEVQESVTRRVPVTKEIKQCVVVWNSDLINWSPALGKSLAYEIDGKPIDADLLRKRLKQPTLVVVSLSGSMIPANVAAMLNPGTIVLVRPALEVGPHPLAPAAASLTRPARSGSRRESPFVLVAFQDPAAPAQEYPGVEFPSVTSPPPSAITAAWRDPDQVTLISRFENEFVTKGVYQVLDGANQVMKVAEVRHRCVNTESVDFPAFSVSAKTVDGRRLTTQILQRFLQVQRTVVLARTRDEVDPFWLHNFRPVVVVMTVPEEPVAPVPMPMVLAQPAPIAAAPVKKRAPRTATEKELEQLFVAAANGDDEQVTQLLNDGLNINQQNAAGETALMRAAANGQNGYVETLITDHQADPSLRNKAGKTAQQLAREGGHDATADAIGKHQK